MKIRKLAFYLLLLLCTTLLLDACNKEMDIPAGYEEAMGQTIYGTADLYIEHVVPMGMGEMTAETTIPLEFPVKIGNRHVDSGEFSIDWEDESEWNFAGAGDFVGVSSIVIVPVTYEVRGVFHNCEFKMDIVEIMHFSQVKWAEVLAYGTLEVDMGEDNDLTYFDNVFTGEQPTITMRDPGVMGRVFLQLSNVALPPDKLLICNWEDPNY